MSKSKPRWTVRFTVEERKGTVLGALKANNDMRLEMRKRRS